MAEVELGVPTIVAGLFFILNVLGLFGIAYYAAANSKRRNLCAALWPQRLIYASLIIFFLDQATDIGVLINWYGLMNDDNDYVSISVDSFFGPLLAFFCIYIFIMGLTTCESAQVYDIVLVFFFLYPFKAAHTSFVESYRIIENTEPVAAKSVELGKQQQEANPTDDKDDEEHEEKRDIMPDEETQGADTDKQVDKPAVSKRPKRSALLSEIMTRLLIIQCTLETMPGLVLQSVFWVRSFNDDRLKGRNSTFIAVSIIASLMSLASRYLWIIDAAFVTDKVNNILYKSAVITYRVLSLFASFIVFVMIWVVMGGVWIGLWIITVFVMWTVLAVANGDPCCSAKSLKEGNQNAIGLTLEYNWKYHLLKFVENLIGMVLIFVFLWSSFECGFCVSAETRESYRGSNNRIAFLFGLGWIASIGAFVIYVFLHMTDVIKTKKE
eukprot:168108_1